MAPRNKRRAATASDFVYRFTFHLTLPAATIFRCRTGPGLDFVRLLPPALSLATAAAPAAIPAQEEQADPKPLSGSAPPPPLGLACWAEAKTVQ